MHAKKLGLRFFKRNFHGLDLLQDIDAIAIFIQHAAESPDLALDTVESSRDGLPRLFCSGHSFSWLLD
jgi:hypothetical protein